MEKNRSLKVEKKTFTDKSIAKATNVKSTE